MHKIFLYLLALLFTAGGVNHFLNTDFYLRMMPRPFPYPYVVVLFTGVIETILGIALLFPLTRKWAAWGIIVTLFAVFPANVSMALHPELWDIPLWMLYVRLPLQFLLVWWAYQYT